MAVAKTQAGRKRSPSVVVCVRVSPALAERLDWLARNDEDTEDRAHALRKGIEAHVKAREDACRKRGLTPLAP